MNDNQTSWFHTDGWVKAQFASFMRLDSQFVWSHFQWQVLNFDTDREIIFVSSEEEAAEFGLPINKAIGWPSMYTLGMLQALNSFDFNLEQLEQHEATFEILELTLPLTIDDIVYNWHSFYHLLFTGLTRADRSELEDYVRNLYGDELIINNTRHLLLFPGRLDAMNALAEGRNVSSINLRFFHWLDNEDLTADDLPMPPFTEEDVRNNPRLVEVILLELLTPQERHSIAPEALIRQLHEQNE